MGFFQKLFPDVNEKKLKALANDLDRINAKGLELPELTDQNLKERAAALRQKLTDVPDPSSDRDALIEVFALTREVASRQVDMRHFDCQILGGLVLTQGKIAEMKTGEGKTLVATLATSFNALASRKSFVVTVNDYLAKRDAEWMRPVYEGLGLSVGTVVSGQTPEEKKQAYDCDVIYATNNELGFDWLRDHMVVSSTQQIQPALEFAIVDEVDSILIDEARTPLIISGASSDSSRLYQLFDKIVPKLRPQTRQDDPLEPLSENELGDYWVDEKNRQVEVTERGHVAVEKFLKREGILKEGNLFSPANLNLLRYLESSLRAHSLFKRDVDYIVRDGEVMLIDEHTGRVLPGRRLSLGVHQALECKERLPVRQETQTLASTTFQNFFRLFETLSGMTGTAMTEALEFMEIYSLDVIAIPPARPLVRTDFDDVVYQTKAEKFEAVVQEIQTANDIGVPCLVGTASVDDSERLSKMLHKSGVKHEVLNAKNHAKEAQIVADAGRWGAITIATNMAGRGTDIVLGGNIEAKLANISAERAAAVKSDWEVEHKKVIEAGGLYIIGTERHESRRIDNQLRGRSGRQGDPGASRFFLSLEDDVIRLFASDRVRNMMKSLGMQKGDAIESRMLTKAIQRAQRQVEERNFDQRKQILEYDSIANEQRAFVYSQRDEILHTDDLGEWVEHNIHEVIAILLEDFVPAAVSKSQWDIPGMVLALKSDYGLEVSEKELTEYNHASRIHEQVMAVATEFYAEKRNRFGPQVALVLERQISLQALDFLWKEHLASLDHLRGSIHLRAYAQRNPKQEYKREAFDLFNDMLVQFAQRTVSQLLLVEIHAPDLDSLRQRMSASAPMEVKTNESAISQNPIFEAGPQLQNPQQMPQRSGNLTRPPAKPQTVQVGKKVGRNEPCPCGSGKKYKFCHGQN